MKMPEPDTASLAYSGRSVDYISGYEDGYEAAADQLRAEVLAEREHALSELAKVKEWLSDKDAPFVWAVEEQIDACAAAIRRNE